MADTAADPLDDVMALCPCYFFSPPLLLPPFLDAVALPPLAALTSALAWRLSHQRERETFISYLYLCVCWGACFVPAA